MRTWSDTLKTFIGDIARPFSIIVTSAAAAWSTVAIAYRVPGFEGAAVFIGAVYAGLAGLYGFKAWENRAATGQEASAEKERSGPPAEAGGELPEDQRVRL